MATHIIQLSEEFEAYLKKQFGTVTPSFKTMSIYFECLMAKDMAEHHVTPHSGIAHLLSSPEVLDDLKARYMERDTLLKESQSLKFVPAVRETAA